jgi:tripartite-type tricarboxylate transporter receptor subunit TctC
MASGIEYVRAGKLRSLAVTTAMRSEALPDLPVLGDFVAGYESSAWYGLRAPKCALLKRGFVLPPLGEQRGENV